MEQPEVAEIKEVTSSAVCETTQCQIMSAIRQHWQLMIVAIVAISLICAIVLISFLVYTKYYGKDNSSKKKKQKCDHPEKSDKKAEVQQEKQQTLEDKLGKLDSNLNELKNESRRQTETEDRERLADEEVSNGDVQHVEENTSYED
jgi:uncharacterized protein YlxW (UPF0749 family)